MLDALWPYVAALVPTIVVAAFFYAIIKRIDEGDRRERQAQRQWEAAQDRAAREDRTAPEDPSAPPSDDSR